MTQHNIYFLISDQHFLVSGGIGSFFRGFMRMAEHFDWNVTVVLDKPPRKSGKALMDAHPTASYVFPDNPVSYAEHNPGESQFKQEIPNDLKRQNFTSALALAHSVCRPTHILINTPEAALSIMQLRLDLTVRTTFYSHHENLVLNPIPKNNKFGPSYMQMLRLIVGSPKINIATQSTHNIQRMSHLVFSSEPFVLPMPIPDPQLLEQYEEEQSGVLFIGRHEPRKQPAVFAQKVAQAGLPAKVLTRASSVKKFEATFAKHGITDYEIQSEIIGPEKADFIRSARVAFHPAKLESYGFSAMETLAAGLPTLLVHEYDWWQAFIDDGVHITPIRDAHNALLELYEGPLNAAPSFAAHREQHTFAIWEEYLNSDQHPG